MDVRSGREASAASRHECLNLYLATPAASSMGKAQLTQYDMPTLWLARRISLEAESDVRLKGWWPLETIRDAALETLGVKLPRSPIDGPLGRLISADEIIKAPHKVRVPGSRHGNGTRNVFRAAGLDRVHLGMLMEEAASAVDPSKAKGNPGRKGLRLVDRMPDTLSVAQFTKIQVMARHVAYHLAPTAGCDEDAYGAVTSAYLMWDPDAGIEGDWRPFYELVNASRPSPKSMAEYITSARLLLDCCSVRGLLLRAARSRMYLVPASWTATQKAWLDAATHEGIAAVLAVTYWLGALAEVFGAEADPAALSPLQVERLVEHVQASMQADRSLTTGHKHSIRRSMRRIMAAGL